MPLVVRFLLKTACGRPLWWETPRPRCGGCGGKTPLWWGDPGPKGQGQKRPVSSNYLKRPFLVYSTAEIRDRFDHFGPRFGGETPLGDPAVVGRPRGGETPLWWGDPGGDPKGPKGQMDQKRPVSL